MKSISCCFKIRNLNYLSDQSENARIFVPDWPSSNQRKTRFMEVWIFLKKDRSCGVKYKLRLTQQILVLDLPLVADSGLKPKNQRRTGNSGLSKKESKKDQKTWERQLRQRQLTQQDFWATLMPR